MNLLLTVLKLQYGVVLPGMELLGHIFFLNDNGDTVNVNSSRYVSKLTNFLGSELRRHHRNRHFWFQQDGATAHTAEISMRTLRDMFPGRIMSRQGTVT